jgi:thiol-disulfide isomerase/thioredoxin
MKYLLFIILLLFSIGTGCTNTRKATTKDKGPIIADLTLKNYNEQDTPLHDFLGKPLVLNSWASWCSFCKKELPDFAQVQEIFLNEVIFIAINRGESKKVAKQYSDNLGVSNRMIMLLDPSDSFYQALGGFAMPETIFVNKDGTINFYKRGIMSFQEAKNKTIELIAANQ